MLRFLLAGCVLLLIAVPAVEAASLEKPPNVEVDRDVPYGIGDWPEALGNHRARIRVEQKADVVWVHLPWRRRDAAPERIEILVVDAAKDKRERRRRLAHAHLEGSGPARHGSD